jgi:hypothetical protein
VEMLKRGKNRPAPAVLRAELETQHGLRSTFGRGKVTPYRGPRCPFPDCRETPAPIFCPTHWGVLDGVMRRELLTELRVLVARGQRTSSDKMRELFKRAIGEIQVALYKAGAKPEPLRLLGSNGKPVQAE